jgi:hypothetical protein
MPEQLQRDESLVIVKDCGYPGGTRSPRETVRALCNVLTKCLRKKEGPGTGRGNRNRGLLGVGWAGVKSFQLPLSAASRQSRYNSA